MGKVFVDPLYHKSSININNIYATTIESVYVDEGIQVSYDMAETKFFIKFSFKSLNEDIKNIEIEFVDFNAFYGFQRKIIQQNSDELGRLILNFIKFIYLKCVRFIKLRVKYK